MDLKCTRYVFSYISAPEIVRDFIGRSANLAELTYGRDIYFARLNHILDQARFLGWGLPRFGTDLPEEFTEIPPAGINHIFENQAKLLVDVAPTTKVMLENGKSCLVKLLCATTAAGDLVWKLHLLVDSEGRPYTYHRGAKQLVKTKGTRIVCEAETLPYDEQHIYDCFGGEKEGVWPMPFLPEFFIDRPIANVFGPEPGVVESVRIQEKAPVVVLATEMVPWYRLLQIDATRALPIYEESENKPRENPVRKVDKLVSGWEDLADEEGDDDYEHQDDETVEVEDSLVEDDEGEDDSATYINIEVTLSDEEVKRLDIYNKKLDSSDIRSKEEAEKLRSDPVTATKAEEWLKTAIGRARLIANCSGKIGAIMSLAQRHQGQQLLIIQPREKWAEKLVEVLSKKDYTVELFKGDKRQLKRYYEGEIEILVTPQIKEDLFIDDIVIITCTSFNSLRWVDQVTTGTIIYGLCIKQLGHEDNNLVVDHPLLTVTSEAYTGPGVDILKLGEEELPIVTPAENDKETIEKPKVQKFKVKTDKDKGRPKLVASYEKALEIAQKYEKDGRKCEIYPPEGSEAVYITGLGEIK